MATNLFLRAVLALLVGSATLLSQDLTLGFEAREGDLPDWRASAGLVRSFDGAAAAGSRCLRLEPAPGAETARTRRFRLALDATPWRGRILRFSAALRIPVLAPSTTAWLALGVEGGGGAPDLLEDTSFRPAAEPEWERHALTVAVAEDAREIEIAIVHFGDEPIWIDELRLENLGAAEDGGPWLRHVSQERFREAPVDLVEMPSALLAEFYGRPVALRAAVISPREVADLAEVPVVYVVHDFGETLWDAWRRAAALRSEDFAAGESLVRVFLDASCGLGHHGFVDSVNNGPRARALVEELAPELEKLFGGVRPRDRRFLAGEGAGGWSALSLQLNHPEAFGGVWATSPDPVDLRSFFGVDLLAASNLYRDEAGAPRPMVREGGRPSFGFREMVERELERGELGGPMAGFEARLSPRGDDGRPQRLFDRETGDLDPDVAARWAERDLGRLLRQSWLENDALLRGRLHLRVGAEDGLHRDEAVRILARDLEALGAEADVVIVAGRDQRDLATPHAEHWPRGLSARTRREMLETAAGADLELASLLDDLDSELGDEGRVVQQADHAGSCSDCGHDHGPGEAHGAPAGDGGADR